MKLSNVFAAVALGSSALVSAQLSAVPDCFRPCIESRLAARCSGPTDLNCGCQNNLFQDDPFQHSNPACKKALNECTIKEISHAGRVLINTCESRGYDISAAPSLFSGSQFTFGLLAAGGAALYVLA